MPGQSQSYLNAALILGSNPAPPFIQRIPVPIAMWKPYKPRDGVPLRLLGPGTTMVAGKRAAILICYEQLLVWPILASAAENPDILIGIANDYWATGPRSMPYRKHAFTLGLVSLTFRCFWPQTRSHSQQYWSNKL